MLVRGVWPSRPTLDSSFGDLYQLRHEMQRLLATATAGESHGDLGAGVFPPLNITQDDSKFYLRAEIPGIKPNELSISVLGNRVSLAGKREIQREDERVSYHRRERAEGAFNRTVTLPAEVDPQGVDARYSEGVLTVTLPKAEDAKPRQITVRT
jgi:HSP20 family protein